MISQLAVFERSTCQCHECYEPCYIQPGCLAPSDIDHIADHIGTDVTEEFLVKMFDACEDGPTAPTDEFPSGHTPAIRPKLKDGKCVFLGAEGQCTIHPVAPFECGRVDWCKPEEGAAAMRALGMSITKSADYVMLWNLLRKKGVEG